MIFDNIHSDRYYVFIDKSMPPAGYIDRNMSGDYIFKSEHSMTIDNMILVIAKMQELTDKSTTG